MKKLISLFLVLALGTVGLAEEDVPLPGPGAPPADSPPEPPPPQPTPPPETIPAPPAPRPKPKPKPRPVNPQPTPRPKKDPRKSPKRKPRKPPVAPAPAPEPPPEPTPEPTPWPTPAPTPAPTPPPPAARKTYTVGTGIVGRFKDRVFNFFIPAHLNQIRALRLTCTNKEIEIKDVIVQFVNGQKSSQHFLVGPLDAGGSRITYMAGDPVYKITVVASSASVFKNKGAFRLDATAITRIHKREDTNEPNKPELPMGENLQESP